MSKFLIVSAAVHLVLLALIPVIPGLGRDERIGLDVYSVELVQLPQEPVRAAEPAAEEVSTEPEERPEEPPEEAPAEKPFAQPRRVILKPRPEREERSLADRITKRLKTHDEERTPPAPEPVESRPAPTTRATVKVSRFPYGWYLSVIQGKVSSNWKQPSARLISEEALSVVVSFRIARSGAVDLITVRRSSGRSTVDQSAVSAVRESAPFPPLPHDYREDRLDVTIEFTVERER